MCQDAAAEIADVAGPLAQVGILHGLEHADVLRDGLAQRPGCPVSLAYALHGFLDQAVATQHQQQRIEQRQLLCRQYAGHAVGIVTQIILDRGHRGPEGLDFKLDVSRYPVRDRLQVGRGIDHHGLSDCHAR